MVEGVQSNCVVKKGLRLIFVDIWIIHTQLLVRMVHLSIDFFDFVVKIIVGCAWRCHWGAHPLIEFVSN